MAWAKAPAYSPHVCPAGAAIDQYHTISSKGELTEHIELLLLTDDWDIV